MLDSEVTSALDRTQTSSKFAAHILKKTVKSTLKATAEVLGLTSEEFDVKLKPVVSTASVKRLRTSNRVTAVSDIQKKITNVIERCFVHWDSKLLPDTPGNCLSTCLFLF